MTTLEVFCAVMGWQGGTLHQARERFAIEDMRTMDAICTRLAASIRDISDPENAQYFMRKRNEACGLVIRAASVEASHEYMREHGA